MIVLRKYLGQILIELGYVEHSHVVEARRNQLLKDSSKRIGEWLIDLGYINEQQLKEALEIQARTKLRG
ncbi:hypothetical protein DRP53_04335 [candidate division WOR-3 bacterium]|uniref:Type II secretion system protein GspE N-terminal domain-containing protein n=1 Tax=candidate division WOR-3 bacterium TaxID=2052148 RepID=A0A660SL05_UNCW3|nr:MAG: hypothetical protein DRP53_04335 [candidate division WOR-3 bacterium]